MSCVILTLRSNNRTYSLASDGFLLANGRAFERAERGVFAQGALPMLLALRSHDSPGIILIYIYIYVYIERERERYTYIYIYIYIHIYTHTYTHIHVYIYVYIYIYIYIYIFQLRRVSLFIVLDLLEITAVFRFVLHHVFLHAWSVLWPLVRIDAWLPFRTFRSEHLYVYVLSMRCFSIFPWNMSLNFAHGFSFWRNAELATHYHPNIPWTNITLSGRKFGDFYVGMFHESSWWIGWFGGLRSELKWFAPRRITARENTRMSRLCPDCAILIWSSMIPMHVFEIRISKCSVCQGGNDNAIWIAEPCGFMQCRNPESSTISFQGHPRATAVRVWTLYWPSTIQSVDSIL